MILKSVLGVLCFVYLLSSNFLFHAFAMDIVMMPHSDVGCSDHDETKNTPNIGCYTSCLGMYNELSSRLIEEEVLSFDFFAFPDFFVDISSLGYGDIDESLYRQLIDSGGVFGIGFSYPFNKIIKKLE